MSVTRLTTAQLVTSPANQGETTSVTGANENTAAETLLRHLLTASGMAVLESTEAPLALLSFAAGRSASWPLSTAQTSAGALWEDNMYPADRPKLQAYLRDEPVENRRAIDYRIIVGEGELLWVRHWTVSRTASADGQARLTHAIMPIPEQKHLEWECLRVSERECNRIGQELHDDLCQVLAGIGFMMRMLEQRARRADAGLAAEIEELSSHLFAATDRVRSMAHGLFPAQLHFASLRDALQGFAAEARTLFRIDIALEVAPGLPRHRPQQIIQVYRVVQESVSNAVRHGRANVVHIEVTGDANAVSVRITDDGTGFAAPNALPEGIGMHVMQYRARALGGTLAINPNRPHGVVVQLDYPVHSPTPVQQLETLLNA